MATMALTADLSDLMAAIRCVEQWAETQSPEARSRFAAEFNALCEAGDALQSELTGRAVRFDLSPKTMALLASHGIGVIR